MQKVADNIYVLVIIAMLGTLALVMSFLFILLRNQHRLSKQKQLLQAAEIRHQEDLLRSVIESEESERERIGRNLHDDVGTALSNLRITIERFAREQHSGELSHRLLYVSKTIIDRIINDVRNMAHQLSPEILSMQTLSEAIEELCCIVDGGGKTTVSLTNKAVGLLDSLGGTKAMAIYRVLEELIANTGKHAEAEKITIVITQEGQMLIIDYRDDGKGLPTSSTLKKGRGLQNIESRLRIIGAISSNDPVPGSGYHIQLKIPLSPEQNGKH
jgi:signal transduction histidine kinase